MPSIEDAKKAAGHLAAMLVEKHMIVGLGTGSTARYFIEKLAERNKKEQLHIRAVASSQASTELASTLGIPLLDINTISSIHITVDGADEIDPNKNMIKGGGGALLREKIVASMSQELVVIVDESKLVTQLGKQKLPLEVLPFGSHALRHKLEKRGFSAHFRMQKEHPGEKYLTDNHNYIIDLHYSNPITQVEQEHQRLIQIPGVLETGLFFHLAGRVIVAFQDGQVTTLP